MDNNSKNNTEFFMFSPIHNFSLKLFSMLNFMGHELYSYNSLTYAVAGAFGMF